ncbi:MAG TPA: tetratricopeptide repeat protein, partial [Longimicrobiales bacterium]
MTRALRLILILLLVPAAARAQNTSKEIFAQGRAAAAGSPQAIELFERYTRMEPDDAWGFLALAEALASAGRFGDAETALQRAETLAPGDDDVAIVKARVERARRAFLPAVKPTAYLTRDTDENTSVTFGAAGDAAVGATLRAGLAGGRTSTDDGVSSATIERGAATLAVKTASVRWEAEAGAARLNHARSRTVAVGQTHLRWSPGTRGVTADVRVRQVPVTSAYSLISAETMLTEA